MAINGNALPRPHCSLEVYQRATAALAHPGPLVTDWEGFRSTGSTGPAKSVRVRVRVSLPGLDEDDDDDAPGQGGGGCGGGGGSGQGAMRRRRRRLGAVLGRGLDDGLPLLRRFEPVGCDTSVGRRLPLRGCILDRGGLAAFPAAGFAPLA